MGQGGVLGGGGVDEMGDSPAGGAQDFREKGGGPSWGSPPIRKGRIEKNQQIARDTKDDDNSTKKPRGGHKASFAGGLPLGKARKAKTRARKTTWGGPILNPAGGNQGGALG